MKKIAKKINIKNISAFIMGGIIFGGISVVVAGAIYANQVNYTKNGQSTVEGALDTLYTRTNTTITNLQNQNAALQQQLTEIQNTCPSGKTCLTDSEFWSTGANMRFAFGTPTDSSTRDYTSLNKYVFVAKSGNQMAVCINYSNKLECFKNNNRTNEIEHFNQAYGTSCTTNSDSCNYNMIACNFYSNGGVSCRINGGSNSCELSNSNNVSCNSGVGGGAIQ